MSNIPTDAATVMFGGTAHQQSTLHNTPDFTAPAGETEAINQSWRSSLRTLGVSDHEGQSLTDLMRGFIDTPADQATREQWRAASAEALTRQYGETEGRQRLETARALARRDAKFDRALRETGLNDHPRVVELLLARSHSLKLQGAL